jgi:multiple sugar transport system substrate-binding protein
MRKWVVGIAIGTLTAFLAVAASAETTIDVLYAFPNNYKELQEKLAVEFRVLHPDIKINFWNPANNYDEATAQVLRNALTDQVPDVYFNGLNQLRVLVDQKRALALDAFVAEPVDRSQLDYIPAMTALGELDGKKYGLPFSISMPLVYVNENLVKAAGGSIEAFPKDWNGILALGKKMTNATDSTIGFLYAHDASGNWLYQALVNSVGGSLGSADGCKVAFDGAQGKWALEMLEQFKTEGMPDLGYAQGRQAFAAGKIGIYVESSSAVALLEKNVAGKFTMRTAPFPMPETDGRLPAGGSLAMVLSTRPERQKVAWEYVKFVTGPVGQTLMAQYTGYAPGNQKALDDPKLLKGYYDDRPNLMTAIKQLPVMTGWYNWAGPNSVKIVDVIQQHVNNVVAGRADAATTMPLMVRDVQKLLPACAGN